MLKGFFCSECEKETMRLNGKNDNGTQRYNCATCNSHRPPIKNDLIVENVKLSKKTQKFQDTNRIERKSFREYARIENAVESYAEQLTKQNKEFGKQLAKIKVPKLAKNKSKIAGIIQITDWHSNEIINLPHNKFDFQVLADRSKKLADEAITIFKAYDINSALIAHTGDVMNSDRRLDELLNQAVNRSKASILTQYILTQFIMHLRQHFKLSIVSVMGNESRMSEFMHSSNNVVSDNYDFTVFANLKEKFKFANIKDIEFGSIDKMEEVVHINGHNILLKHDVTKSTSKQASTQSIIGKYYLQGNPIDHIIAGHIHSTRNTDISSRSSSIGGSNENNEHNLGLIGKASQNIFIIKEDSKHTIAVDLQNTVRGSGYSIIKELEAYNAKSADMSKNKQTVFQVE
jgi:hypothetical protein